MKFENVDVKSNKKTVANVDVEIFENLEEATEHFQDDAKSIDGDEIVLGLVNRQHKTDVTNKARLDATRPLTLNKAIRQAAKNDPDAVRAALAQLGLTGVVLPGDDDNTEADEE